MRDFNGFKLIDLEGNTLTNSASLTIKGIYDKLESNHGVAIIVGNFVMNTVAQCAQFVTCIVNTGTYTIKFANVTLTVTDDDKVAVSVA